VTARRPVFEPRQPRRLAEPLRGAVAELRAVLTVELCEQERREGAEAGAQGAVQARLDTLRDPETTR
jgi:hypothetical protein